ncbi:MAG: tyrosine recombinase XerC [Clostridia bacterium]|nr:tyrosine recombinase XerC [Clostridia bacterium]
MSKLPNVISQFSAYKQLIQNRSPKTVEQYEIDLTLFLKYIKATQNGISESDVAAIDETDISDVDIDFVAKITPDMIMSFLMYAARQRGNKSSVTARKLSAIRSFFKYYTVNKRMLEKNPAKDIESPSVKRALPKYLTIEECIDLLSAIENDKLSEHRERDFAIATLFLNCGMRLSELAGISLSDIDPDMRSLKVTGKGSKNRIIYLNEACKNALNAYLKVRGQTEIRDKNALFISRLGTRISIKTVQWMIGKYLKLAGLEYRNFSVHKLRHTAATLMYQSGQVDIRVLKDILGHEQLNTTQIYTHISNTQMEEAMSANPLSDIKPKKMEEE